LFQEPVSLGRSFDWRHRDIVFVVNWVVSSPDDPV